MVTRGEAATVLAQRSSSRMRRRLRLIQANVPSMIHGFGTTTAKLCGSLRSR
jgi:hypothetical protein